MPTVRQQIVLLLCDQEMGARELSQQLHVTEKEIHDHLTHIARSALSHGQRFTISPARCLRCGFSFKERRRTTAPSRCPRCKNERIEMPTYRITGCPPQ